MLRNAELLNLQNNSENIEQISYFNYLGVFLEEQLKFDHNLTKVVNKV